MNSKADQISFDVLKKAFAVTCMKRETSFGEEEVRETLDKIKDDFGLDEMRNHFRDRLRTGTSKTGKNRCEI